MRFLDSRELESFSIWKVTEKLEKIQLKKARGSLPLAVRRPRFGKMSRASLAAF